MGNTTNYMRAMALQGECSREAARLILAEMERRGITIVEMASRINCHQTTISNLFAYGQDPFSTPRMHPHRKTVEPSVFWRCFDVLGIRVRLEVTKEEGHA